MGFDAQSVAEDVWSVRGVRYMYSDGTAKRVSQMKVRCGEDN